VYEHASYYLKRWNYSPYIYIYIYIYIYRDREREREQR
jgi:hypothetical protein